MQSSENPLHWGCWTCGGIYKYLAVLMFALQWNEPSFCMLVFFWLHFPVNRTVLPLQTSMFGFMQRHASCLHENIFAVAQKWLHAVRLIPEETLLRKEAVSWPVLGYTVLLMGTCSVFSFHSAWFFNSLQTQDFILVCLWAWWDSLSYHFLQEIYQTSLPSL